MLHKKVLRISAIGVCLISMTFAVSAEELYLPKHGLALRGMAQQEYIDKLLVISLPAEIRSPLSCLMAGSVRIKRSAGS